MTKKYKLTEKYIECLGVKLFQIQALAAFGTVAVGELGGYIQSEECLSHFGDAWVYDNAWVYGNARVSDDAQVYGDARVYGDAQVSDDAQVSGDARVYGDAWVYDNAWVSNDARVYGDARVSGTAWVSGNAWVSDDARVYGDARVSDDAQVSGNAQVAGNARVYGSDAIFWASRVGSENGTLTVTSGKNGLVVTRDCFCGSKEDFLEKSAQVHSEKIQREYQLLIEVAESRINHHKAPEPTTASV